MVLVGVQQDRLPDLAEIAGAADAVVTAMVSSPTPQQHHRAQGDQEHDNEQVDQGKPGCAPVERHQGGLNEAIDHRPRGLNSRFYHAARKGTRESGNHRLGTGVGAQETLACPSSIPVAKAMSTCEI